VHKIRERLINLALAFACLALTVAGEGPMLHDPLFPLHALSVDTAFDFGGWTLEALASKVAYGLLAPQRFMDDTTRSRFVLYYLDRVSEAQELTETMDAPYTDPTVTGPVAASATQQQALADLRREIATRAPLAEAILGEQVSQVLDDDAFGLLDQLFPPVSGTVTPLPYVLNISRRDHIEKIYQEELEVGLTAAQQETLESEIEAALPEFSAYVAPIGGLSAYPSMLLENPSIDWLADVMAHEWTHHYLLSAPLGWDYSDSGEARTINETTASLMGEWAGQEVVRRFYAPLFAREKPLPDPLTRDVEAETPRFDYRAEMHRTRVMVDLLLSVGKVEEAEWYMEMQPRTFLLNGYSLRRLNQAYFAFHGAFASRAGASGSDPVGPMVRRLWAFSASPHDFILQVSRTTTLAELRATLGESAN